MNCFEQLVNSYNEINVVECDLVEQTGLGGVYKNGYALIEKNQTTVAKRCILAEEYQHHKTSSGDILDQESIETCKQEYTARKKACFDLVKLDDLIMCKKFNLNEAWEIAEFLEVEINFLWDAVNYYRNEKGIVFTYKKCVFDLSRSIDIHFLT